MSHLSDDDKTPRQRPGPRSYPLGVPVPASPSAPRDVDVTSPVDLLEREADLEVQAAVQRSRRESSDPATFGDVVKLAVALTRERSENRQRAVDAEAVLRSPHEVAAALFKRIAATEKALRSARRHLIAAALAAATSIGAVVVKWNDHAAAAGGDAVRVQQLEHDIDRIDGELRELRGALGHRSQLLPTASAGVLPASIATQPTAKD